MENTINGSTTIKWIDGQAKLRMQIDKGRIMQNSFGVGHGFPIEGANADSV